MLARKHRLPTGISLPRQNALIQPSLIIRVRPNNLEESRFGFLVSKKVSKKAVARNNVRRRLQACVQEHLVQTLHGYDVLVIAQPASVEQSKQSLCEQLLTGLAKKGLLHEIPSNNTH
jgi:ribonuclease P protein component